MRCFWGSKMNEGFSFFQMNRGDEICTQLPYKVENDTDVGM